MRQEEHKIQCAIVKWFFYAYPSLRGGLLFAVPVFSVIYYLIKVFAETRLAAKELPIESEKYLYNSDFDYTKINESIHNRIEKTKKRRLNRKKHTNAKD